MVRHSLRDPYSGRYEKPGQRYARQQSVVATHRQGNDGVFTKILKDAVDKKIDINAEGARAWFRDQAKDTTITAKKLMSTEGSGTATNQAIIGSMYLFQYDPKLKGTLPYYDVFPLVFPIGPAEGGFLGINMHYLPFDLRARLMDALYDLTNNKKYDDSTKLKISYQILKQASKFRFFKPCIKHYLYGHVKSRYITIHPMEWDIALFLPLQQFQKQSQVQVWADSRKKV